MRNNFWIWKSFLWESYFTAVTIFFRSETHPSILCTGMGSPWERITVGFWKRLKPNSRFLLIEFSLKSWSNVLSSSLTRTKISECAHGGLLFYEYSFSLHLFITAAIVRAQFLIFLLSKRWDWEKSHDFNFIVHMWKGWKKIMRNLFLQKVTIANVGKIERERCCALEAWTTY